MLKFVIYKMKAWLCVIRKEKNKGPHVGVSIFCSVYFTENKS
jgi:hypothetical protein